MLHYRLQGHVRSSKMRLDYYKDCTILHPGNGRSGHYEITHQLYRGQGVC